ncbi:p21-activated protein kinase-interacting protein 1-like protein [Rhynchospora pubera]|uniref:P21-activated protein kinase-interacting protein 1-like protein n=1 Tax=Rhynchospora pubera TaxID=906938 RepID=A0AAV8GYS0_9POAL|nr:p21-activated protein kinase-interacting protein 1-like protein [Rhynchospora pubera]
MALVAGSYEKFIWGFSLKTLTPLFSYPSHTAPIKCAAAAGPLAASGGADDAVHIYHLPSSSDAGSLVDHSAAVTSLSFFCSPSAPSIPRNLISGSDDGVVCIFDADPFVLLKTVKAHKKGGVADLAVHPSGRLALTVGRGDSSLVMVNLVRGRRSFSCRIEKEASVVKYGGENGDWFAMASDGTITVHNSEDARVLQELDCERKVLCIAPGESEILYTGGEDRHVTAWDTKSGKKAFSIQDAHKFRVKGLVSFKGSDSPKLIASASSDGVIRVWDINMASSTEKWTPLLETDTKSRLTCLAGTSFR